MSVFASGSEVCLRWCCARSGKDWNQRASRPVGAWRVCMPAGCLAYIGWPRRCGLFVTEVADSPRPVAKVGSARLLLRFWMPTNGPTAAAGWTSMTGPSRWHKHRGALMHELAVIGRDAGLVRVASGSAVECQSNRLVRRVSRGPKGNVTRQGAVAHGCDGAASAGAVR